MYSQVVDAPRPQKQGGLYSLNLGQNNGPYLSKDVMAANQKNNLNQTVGREEFGRNTTSVFANVG
jgi:hypothetical protein